MHAQCVIAKYVRGINVLSAVDRIIVHLAFRARHRLHFTYRNLAVLISVGATIINFHCWCCRAWTLVVLLK
jgi:hypothetical protein